MLLVATITSVLFIKHEAVLFVPYGVEHVQHVVIYGLQEDQL
jgi:hypothetical protein